MYGKGKIRGGGAALARYVMTGKKGEKVEIVGQHGFEFFDKDMVKAFDAAQHMAETLTKSTKPFMHITWRAAPGEQLTNEQGEEMAQRTAKRMGMDGQPYLLTAHIHAVTGERHFHLALFRMDVELERSIDPGLFKFKLKELAREFEKDFGLRIVSNQKKPGDRAKDADRNEHEESRRLGTNDRAIRNIILDCIEKSDSGKALKAALKSQNLELAYGDRRDLFVVIDQEGGKHTLKKKLTGLTLAEIRARFSDLDGTLLPSIEEAKAMQRDRQGDRQQQAKERAADKKPLGQTASLIREAARSKDFACGLKKSGLILAYVTPEEAKASEHGKAIARAAGRKDRALKEGFVVVDQKWNVSRVDARTTGEHWKKIEAKLAITDRSQLPSVAEARAQMKELNREALEKKGTERKTVHSLEAQEAALKAELAQLRRAFEAEASRTTEPAPYFDRDKADAEWMNRLEKAAIEREIEKDKAAQKPRKRGKEKEPDAPATHGPYADMRAAESARDPVPGKPLGKTAIAIRAACETSRTGQQLGDALAAHGIGLAVVTPEEAKGIESPVFKQRHDGKTYEPWMMQAGGVSELSEAYRESAERSYQKWAEIKPDLAAKHDLADYVQYVQGKWASGERRPEDRPSDRRPAFKEGELVAVDGRGEVYRFNERTTGEKNPDIDARFPGIGRTALLSVTDTQVVMREASLAAWKTERQAEREAARPASWIESKIAECGGQSGIYAGADGTFTAWQASATVTRNAEGRTMTRAEIFADQLEAWRSEMKARETGEPNTYPPKGEAVTVYGKEAFAARLIDEGITVVRVTASDVPALEALRQGEDMKRQTAETNRESTTGNRFADLLMGDLAAVTSKGDVYRINPDKLGDAASLLPENLPSVTEARAAFEIDRETCERLGKTWQAEAATYRETRAAEREERTADAQDRRDFRQTANEIAGAVDAGFSAARKTLEKAAKMFEGIILFFDGGPAKRTKAQIHQEAQARGNVETRAAENAAVNKEANDTARDDQISESERDRNIREAELYNRYGDILNQPAQPREIQRGGGRERERDRGRDEENLCRQGHGRGHQAPDDCRSYQAHLSRSRKARYGPREREGKDTSAGPLHCRYKARFYNSGQQKHRAQASGTSPNYRPQQRCHARDEKFG